MSDFLSGAVFSAALISALFFFKFWKQSKDRFFLIFAIAFLLLGFERVQLLFTIVNYETRSMVYCIRLCSFILILIAILDKNKVKKA